MVASINFYVSLKPKDLNAIKIFEEKLVRMYEEELNESHME